MKNSPGAPDADLLHGLLQKYEDASVNVQSHKTVIKAYGNIAHMSAVAEVVSARQDLLLMAFEQQASVGGKVLSELTMIVQKLEELNRNLTEENTRLHSDLERLRLEYQRQIGVLPKAMKSSKKRKDQPEEDPSGDDKDSKPKRRGAPKGHRGNTRAIPSEVNIQREEPPPSQCNCGCGTIMATDQTDTKYIEDILPVCSQITKITYQRGICANCGSLVRHEDALHGPPCLLAQTFQHI